MHNIIQLKHIHNFISEKKTKAESSYGKIQGEKKELTEKNV